MKIKNDQQAYFNALVLAITAPTEEKSQECIQIAELIGSKLTAKQRNICQKHIEYLNESDLL
jgi:hypothetical protein